MIKIWTLALFCSLSVFANDAVDTDGHTPGRFTMDLDAATKYAAEKDLPILFNFTGSDWCGWCKLMDKNVFNKDEWKAYAKNNVVMVWIDFPKNKDLVPQKYVARNKELQAKYAVRGFPTYLLIDAKTNAVIGKLGAGRDKTPASFKAEVDAVAAMSAGKVKSFAESLGGEKGPEYLKMFEKIKQNEAELKAAQEAYNAKVKTLNEEISSLKSNMEETRVISRLKPEQVEEYKKTRAELKEAQAAVQKFLAGKPEQNLENMNIYKDLGDKVKAAQAKLSKF